MPVANRIAQPRNIPPEAGVDRRTGRTVQFATRVSPEFHDRIRQIARYRGLLLVEVLERALEALESSR